MIGARFGMLLVIDECEPQTKTIRGKVHKRRMYCCKCDCGCVAYVEQSNLRTGNSQSCGCQSVKATISRSFKHGHALRGKKHELYDVWSEMHNRCRNPNHRNYRHYGGRGITVCDRWQAFENFLSDMGERPSKKHSIDRKDNDGNYEPSNCRWATTREQSLNKRTYKNARLVTYKGRQLCVSQAAKVAGINESTLRDRLRRGWTDEWALVP